jgi:hypothetical protein
MPIGEFPDAFATNMDRLSPVTRPISAKNANGVDLKPQPSHRRGNARPWHPFSGFVPTR